MMRCVYWELSLQFVCSDGVLPLVQLFRRIMASARHKQQHNFRLSYQLEVGSSVDPDMEDISRWEHELQGRIPITPLVANLFPLTFDQFHPK